MTMMYRYDERDGGAMLSIFYVYKRTPKGCWVSPFQVRDGEVPPPWMKKNRRFVLNDGRKRYCWETRELALESLKQRAHRRMRILNAHLHNCETVLSVIDAAQSKGEQLTDYMQLDLSGELYTSSTSFL